MNLLPKTHEEFSKADYWDTFFKKRGKKAFEWYGEFPELSSYLLQYIKPNNHVLIVGCGNSTLGMDLYDADYKNVVNIDVSQVVIKQMQDINKRKRPELIFEQMDATNMTYENEKFSVILDKGTLDALMPDSDENTVTLINKYFEEIKRVLKNSGRYICISLLQEHILRNLLASFSSTFAFRVIRCHDVEFKAKEKDESQMPVFMVVATKFIKLPHPILEMVLANGPLLKLSNIKEVVNTVKSTQESAFICNSLHKSSVVNEGEVSFDLYKPGDKDPKYTIYIVDKLMVKERKTYAAFIVPQGRETDWIFCSKEGRQELLKSTENDRLAVVILRREHHFESMDAVKNELEESIKNFAPSGLSNKIPFLSVESDIGQRKTIYEGQSDFSGPFVIDEIETDGILYRRLIFLNNQFVVQSEAKLKQVKTRRKKLKYVVDHNYVACDHHLCMAIGLNTALLNKTFAETVIIGLGGGGLCTFIRQYILHTAIIAVEIDPTILKIATEYFNLVQDEKMKVEINDGIEYLKSSLKQGKIFDAILFDVDSKDPSVGMSCPPKQFVEPEFLEIVKNCLCDEGLFILNLVARNKELRDKTINDLNKIYKFVVTYKTEEDVNEVIFCFKKNINFKEWKILMQESAKALSKITESKDNVDTKGLLIPMFLNNLKIES